MGVISSLAPEFSAALFSAAAGFPALCVVAGGAVALATLLAAIGLRRLLAARFASLLAALDEVWLSALIALAMLVVYGALGAALEWGLRGRVTLTTTTMLLATAASVAVTYSALRERLQRAVDSLFFRDYYDFGPTLRRFSQELASLRDEEGVVSLLLDGLVETLNLSGVAFVAFPEGLDERVLALLEAGDLRARRGYATEEGRRDLLARLARLRLDPRHFSEQGRDAPLLPRPWPGCEAIVLVGRKAGRDTRLARGAGAWPAGALGLLLVGAKRSGRGLRRNDLALLATLAHQAATALENATLARGWLVSLEQVRESTAQLVAARAEQQLLLRELVDADERQRAALAHDLHDDALQEALYLARHSRFCLELAERVTGDAGPAALERMLRELRRLPGRADSVEAKLRALCLGLYPALLSSLGLVAALEGLCDEMGVAARRSLALECADETAQAAPRLSEEQALHVYRVAQEAMRNAAKHSGTGAAYVSLALVSLLPRGAHPAHPTHLAERTERAANEASRRAGLPPQREALLLEVTDAGAGMALPVDFTALLSEGRLGLAGMRERAERIGARLDFVAAPGGGVRVSLLVPLPVEAERGAAQALSRSERHSTVRV